MKPIELVRATGFTRDNVDQMLSRMSSVGEILKVSRGMYIHPDRNDLFPAPRQNRQMSD